MNISRAFHSALDLQKDNIRVAKGVRTLLDKGAIEISDIPDSCSQMAKTEKISKNPIKKILNFSKLFLKMIMSPERPNRLGQILTIPERPNRLGQVITIPKLTEEQLAEIDKIKQRHSR